jgi:DNA-binding LytR/AlgR family response regulator
VVVLDGTLVDASGLELAAELRSTIAPAPACLLVTGDTYARDFEAFSRAGLTVLHKPVPAERLRAAFAAAAGAA